MSGARRRKARGRKISWKWALPGLLLVLLHAAFAQDVYRFVESVSLYGGRALPSIRLEWQLRRYVEPAIERRDPDAALRYLEEVEADARLFEHRVTPYRVRAWLEKDHIENALSHYERYLAFPEGQEMPEYVHTVLSPYMKAMETRRRDSRIRLTDVTVKTGSGYHHQQRAAKRLDALDQAMGSGVGLIDLDRDGYLDIFYVGGMKEPAADGVGNALFRDRGNGSFENVTARSGLGFTGFSYGVAAADLTGDGLPELYVTCKGRNHLFLNLGGMRFHDITESARVAGAGGISTAAAFADIDGDGDLDLYVSQWVRIPDREDRVLRAVFGDRNRLALFAPHMYQPEPNQMFRNDGDGTFTDITTEAGVEDGTGRGLGVLLTDFSGDGFPDLFVANDESPNRFYLNDGRGRFEDISTAARMYDARAGMGVAVTDADGDGAMDILYTNFRTEYNALALNRLSSGYFSEQTEEFGLAASSLGVTSWGIVAVDLDNDMDNDLALVNGHPTPFDPTVTAFSGEIRERSACIPEPAMVYERRDESFVEVSTASGFGETRTVGRGLVTGDLDRDGRPDLVLSTNNEVSHVFKNDSDTSNHWLVVRPRWKPVNRLAVGATVIVDIGGETQRAVVLSGGSYLSQGPFELHFGLGPHDGADRVRVIWPDGTNSVVEDVAANRILTVDIVSPVN